MLIAFLSTRSSKPSFRFRVEQMLPFFKAAGHQADTFFLPSNAWRRLLLYRQLARYDVTFLQKRLLSRAELLVLRRSTQKLVYDLDDAVMFDGDGNDDRRRKGRFLAIARAADLIVCGNQFLAEQASCATHRIMIVPTCIDTEAYHPRLRTKDSDRVTIGWTGSRSTNAYLNSFLLVLSRVNAPTRVKIISDTVAGIEFGLLGKVPCSFVPWSPSVEISEAATFDIGVMPLPDNRWSQGKCGFKALQYMALGIPAVCSPVGVNRDIVHDGIDGFLADSPDEWFQTIARLIKDPFLRETVGHAGRRRVDEAFSLAAHGPRLVRVLENLRRSLRRTA